ncbi:hypothetical protein LCGC14_1290480 [marine sediment metagenome]|uniref:Uncharacterized protein n=2 Tax=root TaxID=1 RepID=A0A831VNL9_9FLAO|nr:hypothetical protein [Pricia antarctica]
MDNKKKESQPADMHSDGVHFDSDILESKRNESARASDAKEDTSENLKSDSSATNSKDKEDKKDENGQTTAKKDEQKIIDDMEGGYNRDAPINDKNNS